MSGFLTRVISAVIMVPVLIGAILCPMPQVFQALCLLCLGIALHEYFRVVWSEVPRYYAYFGTLIGVAFIAYWILGGEQYVSGLAVTSLMVGLGFLFFAIRSSTDQAHHRLGHLVFGVLYIAGLGTHMALLRGLDHGIYWVFSVLAATWLNDTTAYFVGHKWGRHHMAPSLSPGKTWEGWCGGLIGSAIGVFALWYLLPNPLTWLEAGVLVLLAAVFGPAGDLSESLLKRSLAIKDSGHVIPGHGGMLDRIDALLFTGPLFYYFAIWVA